MTYPTEKPSKTARPYGAMPTVAVIGLGYVGAVSAVKLAQRGCHVLGVESNAVKLEMFQRGRCPVREPGLSRAFGEVYETGRFQATDDVRGAVRRARVVFVCVGTPSDLTGSVDLGAIQRVSRQIAEALVAHPHPPVVVIRSTVPPGTTRMHIAPTLHAGNPDTVVCHHPEFLREGSAFDDWDHPAMIVYGAEHRDRPAVRRQIDQLYAGIEAPVISVGLIESELMKYACNVFHAIKIDFANEVAAVAEAVGADPTEVMETFCCDAKLNLSTAYLKPGFAFGGSCLPKDTRALVTQGQRWGLNLPLIESVLPSNESHLVRQVQRVLRHGRKPTLLLGLSFKAGTDDLRESPTVELAERLLGKGVPLTIYDPDLQLGQLIGTNETYISKRLPHLKQLLCEDLDAALRDAEVIVIAKPMASFARVNLPDKVVIDLTGSHIPTPRPHVSHPRAGWDQKVPTGQAARQAA